MLKLLMTVSCADTYLLIIYFKIFVLHVTSVTCTNFSVNNINYYNFVSLYKNFLKMQLRVFQVYPRATFVSWVYHNPQKLYKVIFGWKLVGVHKVNFLD